MAKTTGREIFTKGERDDIQIQSACIPEGFHGRGHAALICGTASTRPVLGANERLPIAVAGVNGRGKSHIGG